MTTGFESLTVATNSSKRKPILAYQDVEHARRGDVAVAAVVFVPAKIMFGA